jgi:hypothetical protein
MSNFLRGFGRAVGFADNTECRGSPPGQGDNDWEAVSHASSQGEVNILQGARMPGPGQHPGGGDQQPGGNYTEGNNPQRDWQQPWEGGGNIPRAINQDNALDIQRNLSMGDGQDQQGGGEGGVPEQHLAAEAPGGGLQHN